MNKHFALNALVVCSLAATFVLGACDSSAPMQAGHAGSGGGKAGASGGAGGGGAGGSPSTGTGGARTIGTSGGTVSASAVTLTIPAAALSADTNVTVETTTAPVGYALASAAYQFGPAGTTFAKPVMVEIPLTAPTPGAHLFWSNSSGGFDDLGGTATNMTLVGMVTHFSVGFAAVPTADGGSPDAGASGGDGGPSTDAVGPANDAAAADVGVDAVSDVVFVDGAAGATATDDGAAGVSGSDASIGNDAAAGTSGGAGAGGDLGLCATVGFNAPTFTPTIINDGSVAPDGSTYTGGAIGTGQLYLTGVTHYGITYGGPTRAVYTFNATAKTLKIAEIVGASVYYVGLEYLVPRRAHAPRHGGVQHVAARPHADRLVLHGGHEAHDERRGLGGRRRPLGQPGAVTDRGRSRRGDPLRERALDLGRRAVGAR